MAATECDGTVFGHNFAPGRSLVSGLLLSTRTLVPSADDDWLRSSAHLQSAARVAFWIGGSAVGPATQMPEHADMRQDM